jgi:undecaprenyl-phosphate galactose phosphotransferase
MYQDSAAILARHFQENPAAREEWRQTFKLKNDPRITPLGRYLRRFSVDELPQLWNVLVGDMSLVGPRPIVVEEIERYGDKYAAYAAVRPGITGLWQISGRSDTAYGQRVRLDERYVREWSFGTDLIILLKTTGVVLRGRGAY